MEGHLDRPGATLAFTSVGPSGAAHALVVAHPLTSSRRYDDDWGVFDWSPVAADGERLVRFDMRGHGTSSGSSNDDDYRWPNLADDLLAVAAAVAPEDPVDGLGESTGCGVVLWAAVKAPDRFRRLILVAPPTMGETRNQQADLFLAAASLVELRGMEAWRRAAAALPPVEIIHAGGWPRNLDPSITEELLPHALRGEAASRLPDEETLSGIAAETLILAWPTDRSHPLDAAAQLNRLLPNSTLEVATTPDHIRAWGPRAADFLRQP